MPAEAVWIDLLEPTPEEEAKLEKFLGIEVPTREEMREIETSNRLYEEDGALYMTATITTKIDTATPENSQVTFILAGNRLITNRYVDPLPFRRYVAYAERHPQQCASGAAVLAGLLEATINRIADVIERVGANLDALSLEVFTPPRRNRPARDFREILERVGQNGDLAGKARETLASLGRLLVFAQQATTVSFSPDVRGRLRTISRDVTQMADHATFLANKVNFILDATLGMINIDQNNILKIFSVVTVFLLPPSVIGAMFGMNFEVIPTSANPYGFWIAIGMMVLSAVVPYLVFKRRGWL
ncbi:MAG: magnesium transporter CorA family protein [Steroidobacteraceae bacterium]|nr:magnesium transporter CorA family protein [Steroidobacteraceae bacterium]